MASKLTLVQARKVLGQLADGVSDEQLQKEIEAANLLKSIYFTQRRGKSGTKSGVKHD